jgi:hypothetical protein
MLISTTPRVSSVKTESLAILSPASNASVGPDDTDW